jgi:hypothetical protein
MKKVSRIAIAIGAVLVLIGFVWSGFSPRHIWNDVDMIGQKHYTPLHASFDAAPVQSIDTDLGNIQIRVAADAGSAHVTVDYFKTQTEQFKVTDTGGAVSVTRAGSEPSQFMCLFRCIGTPHTITIHVPAASAYAYRLTADNASVNFTNSATLQAQSIRVESSNSTVQVANIAAHGAVTLRSSNGNIRLRGLTTDGILTLDSSNGTNQLTNVTAPAIHATALNGGDTLAAVTTKNLNVRASNATVSLSQLHADHTTITSDNGGVKGSLAGPKDNYSIKVQSSNGSIHLNGASYDGSYFSGNDSAPKSLSVSASNGGVDLTFDK